MPAAFCPYSVTLVPGVTLVEASAGTGKTTALTALVARLVVDPEARVIDDAAGLPDLRRALAVTFTNAATAELVTRVRRTLRAAATAFAEDADPDAAPAPVRELLARWGQTPETRAQSRTRLGAALASGEASVFTIDGFLKRVLERSAFESGEPFAFSVADSDAELRRRALAETWQARVRQSPELAAVAVAGGAPWSLARLDAALVDILRHPGTRIVPAPEPLAVAVARYRAAVAGLAAVWNEAQATALLDGAPLTKSAPADPAGLFGRVSAFVARGGTAHVDAVLAAGSARLADGVHKSQGKAARAEILGHAAFGACDTVAEAAEALRLAVLADAVPAVDAARRRLGARAGTLTFDDLLSRVHDALHHARIGPVLSRAIRGQYRVALVDEFQDTNARQDAVFRAAFDGAPLVLVGDPKQAVYAFRGADVFAYLGARRHAAQTFTLARNYRSAPALVGAVNALFERGAESGARPFVHDGIPFVPAEAAVAHPRIRGARTPDGSAAPFVWWSTAHLPQGRGGSIVKAVATPACVAAVVAEIRRLVDDPAVEVCETVDGTDVWRRLRAADVAVLVATNRQAGLVQNALRRAGLPSVIGKGGDVRTAPEMADLEHILRAVDAPGNRVAVRTALATELWGWDDMRIAALDEPAWADLTDALRTVRALWQRRGVFQAVTAWAEAHGVLARLLARPDGERRATNLRHALELAHDAEGSGAQSADRLLRWMRTRLAQPASGETVEMRLESDEHAVQVATMHGCKGLQYRVVFAPFLWEGREKATWHGSFSELAPPRPHVPTEGGGTEIVYDVGSPDVEHHRALADAERLAEHLRLT
ncbi:MAG TPA: UvrD-helicase domain-containing protein, partial [Rubricoccaceae bacterium]